MEFSEPPSSSALTEFHDAMEDPIEPHLSDHLSPEADEPDPPLSDHSSPEADESDAPLSDRPMQLLPPSTTEIYRTLEALIHAVNKHASSQGYAVVKAGQKKNKDGEIIASASSIIRSTVSSSRCFH